MATEKPNTALQNALCDDIPEEGAVALRSEIRAMFDTLSEAELVEEVIARVQRHALEVYRYVFREEPDLGYGGELKVIKDEIHKELGRWVSWFVSDEHRKLIVRYHARGMSTSAAVGELIVTDRTINRIAQKDALGAEKLRKMLIQRLAYLKPGSARWPERKFGSVWREAREQHRRDVSDIPYASKVEQVALLAKNAERINQELEEPLKSAKDLQVLTTSLTKTVESMQKVVVEHPNPPSLSAPQLVAVLERLTLALKTPEPQGSSSEVAQLAGVLEWLTLALKAPEQKRIGSVAPQVAGIVEHLRLALNAPQQKAKNGDGAKVLPAEASDNAEESE